MLNSRGIAPQVAGSSCNMIPAPTLCKTFDGVSNVAAAAPTGPDSTSSDGHQQRLIIPEGTAHGRPSTRTMVVTASGQMGMPNKHANRRRAVVVRPAKHFERFCM